MSEREDMTPELEEKLNEMSVTLAAIKQDVDEINSWIFEVQKGSKMPPRSERIDQVLFAVRVGATSGRTMLYLAGAVGTIATAFAVLKGWITFSGPPS